MILSITAEGTYYINEHAFTIDELEPKLTAIVETGGRIHQNHRRINLPQKPPRPIVIPGYDGFGVAGTELGNVRDGVIHTIYHFNRQDQIQIFSRPVRIRGYCRAGQ